MSKRKEGDQFEFCGNPCVWPHSSTEGWLRFCEEYTEKHGLIPRESLYNELQALYYQVNKHRQRFDPFLTPRKRKSKQDNIVVGGRLFHQKDRSPQGWLDFCHKYTRNYGPLPKNLHSECRPLYECIRRNPQMFAWYGFTTSKHRKQGDSFMLDGNACIWPDGSPEGWLEFCRNYAAQYGSLPSDISRKLPALHYHIKKSNSLFREFFGE